MASRYAKQIGASLSAGAAKTLIAFAFRAKSRTERCESHARSRPMPPHASPLIGRQRRARVAGPHEPNAATRRHVTGPPAIQVLSSIFCGIPVRTSPVRRLINFAPC